jgi:hypothetical protein
MNDQLADIDLERTSSPQDDAPPPRNQRPVVALVVAAVLLFALTAAYVFLRRAPAVSQAPANVAKPAPAPEVRREEIALPPLDDTDPIVRQLVGKLSSHPMVARWLTTDALIVNFVAVTARVATGVTPSRELKAMGPVPRFATRTSGDHTYIDRASYRRYDAYAEAFTALDARGTAGLYTTLKPRIRDAYSRLVSRDDDFDPVLERAIIELLEVPVVEGDIALQPHGTVWAFEDPSLQRLTAAQKQLLRMGPQNVRAVQSKLREIAGVLGIPASKLPPPK